MAINLSETTSCNNTITISPRISFSHSLSQSDTAPVEQLIRSISPSSSSPDFNFCIHHDPDHLQASMADELFFDGKLIPTHLKPPPLQQSKQSKQSQQSKQLQELQQESQQTHQTKSFWGFKRSSSCGNGYARSLCPLPLLSRSNSTGSSTSINTNTNINTKRSLSSKEGCASKQCSNNQKPPLRKTSYSYGSNVKAGNGVRINPVLNLGFGSLFSSGKKK